MICAKALPAQMRAEISTHHEATLLIRALIQSMPRASLSKADKMFSGRLEAANKDQAFASS